jgi:uncharacterized integral membrane protein (TIGR00698 family)
MAMPWHVAPPICLALGLTLGLLGWQPWPKVTRQIGRYALQISVVLLGFGAPLKDVLDAGLSGIALTLLSLAAIAAVGWALAQALDVAPRTATLVTVGTAICGGSAIAAAAPVIKAKDHETAAALATIFVFNACSLVVFPFLGRLAGLTPSDFATWAALAIHDTSSVVGAALSYDSQSVAQATILKLARTLWIVPVCLVLAHLFRDAKANKTSVLSLVPWFLPGFLMAAVIRAQVGDGAWTDIPAGAARIGLALSLLCIGAGVSRTSLAQAGKQALVLGFLLWLFAALGSLAFVALV